MTRRFCFAGDWPGTEIKKETAALQAEKEENHGLDGRRGKYKGQSAEGGQPRPVCIGKRWESSAKAGNDPYHRLGRRRHLLGECASCDILVAEEDMLYKHIPLEQVELLEET